MNIGAIITIILVVAWVVKGLASVTGNKDDGEKTRPSRSLEEWDELQASRRDERAQQRDGLNEMRAQSASQDPAQMTMAERIELARQRARQQAGMQNQGEAQAEALRRARAQAERQAQQKRDQAQQVAAQRERAAKQQQQARRERAQQQRRRQAQQAAQDAQQQRQRRSKQQRRTKQRPTQAATGSQREKAVAQQVQRVNKGHQQASPVALAPVTGRPKPGSAQPALGKLNRNALRQAFIMKELLDKPVALRDPQADLLS